MPTWRELIAGGLYATGVIGLVRRVSRSYSPDGSMLQPWKWRPVQSSSYIILCYHRIGRGGVPIYSWLDTDAFEAQIRYVRRHYRIISIQQLANELAESKGFHSKQQTVAITFDDGYRSTYVEALPILRKYRVPALVYLTVDAIETGNVAWYDRIFLALQVASADSLKVPGHWPGPLDLRSPLSRLRSAERLIKYLRSIPNEKRLEACGYLDSQIPLLEAELSHRMLTWEQVGKMHLQGIEFGSHTLTHPVISRLARAEVQQELRGSKLILEQRIGAPVRHFAYPFGQADDCGTEAREVLMQSGYDTAATTCSGVNRPGSDPYLLRRISVGPGRSLAFFAWNLSRLFMEPLQQQHPEPLDCNSAVSALGGAPQS
jgi:peptidoglycan/xylan/chitin deacetylase (PgdA/CDA1 family)